MKPLKVKASEIRTCDCAYLYADGHLVLVHSKRDKDAGKVNWVTVYEKVVEDCAFDGRIVIRDTALPFVLAASRVGATPPAVSNGSENTKKLNLAVGHVSLYSKNNPWPWHVDVIDNLISSEFTIQPGITEEFSDLKKTHYWSNYKIKRIHRCAGK